MTNAPCKHLHVEVYDYRPRILLIGYRCVDCQAPLMVKAGVHEKFWPNAVPAKREYLTDQFPKSCDPFSFEARICGYENHHMARF